MNIDYNYKHVLSACKQVDKINNIISNKKIENIYKNLFTLLNISKNDNNLLIKIWIEHLQQEINNILNILDECENFITNYNNTHTINKLDNKEIESLYILSLMKQNEFI